jgi:hypothetical protein
MNEKMIHRLGLPLSQWQIDYRIHATRRMFERNIDENEILEALEFGDVIEDYKDDFPFPTVLVNRSQDRRRPLHVVVGVDIHSRRLYIITVYEPDNKRWFDDYSRRIKP